MNMMPHNFILTIQNNNCRRICVDMRVGPPRAGNLATNAAASDFVNFVTDSLACNPPCMNNGSLKKTQNSWWCHSGAMWQLRLWLLPAKLAGTSSSWEDAVVNISQLMQLFSSRNYTRQHVGAVKAVFNTRGRTYISSSHGDGDVPYLCTVAALCVVVVLGSQLTVCVFIRGYAVVVMLVIINAQVQWFWQQKNVLTY